jgi:hypothetical protein
MQNASTALQVEERDVITRTDVNAAISENARLNVVKRAFTDAHVFTSFTRRPVGTIEELRSTRSASAVETLRVAARERLVVLQDWEGVVEEVRKDDFFARLRDRTSGSNFDAEAAEIPISEVDSDDLPLLKPGAIFYLTIYRRILESGRHERTTRMFFRRLPAWTPTMLQSVKDRADRWKSFFSVAKSKSSSAG